LKHALFISIKFITERKKQAFIMMAGVAIGVMAFVVMSAMMKGFRGFFIEQALNVNGHIKLEVEENYDDFRILRKKYNEKDFLFDVLGSQPKDIKDKIPNWKEIIKRYSKNPNFIGATPHLTGSGLLIYGNKERNVSVVGIEPQLEDKTLKLNENLYYHRLNQLNINKNNIIIGIKLAQELGIDKADKKITFVSPAGGVYVFKVVDFLNTGITEIDKNRVYIHLKKFQTVLNKPNEVNEIIFKVKDPENAIYYAKLLAEGTGYKAESWQETFKNFLAIFKLQDYITYSIVIAILIVAAFGIFNITMMTVLEKKRDIAILKAFGYDQKDIIFIFAFQAVLIGIIGGIVGNIGSFIIMDWLESLDLKIEGMVRTKGFILDRNPMYNIVGFTFAYLFSIVAAIYPSYKASKLYPVDIFRTGG
jgi:lipoprotein-releasing system permease protein